MKNINIKKFLIYTLVLICSASCNKEEVLVPSSQDATYKHEFPENTPFDNITKEIYDNFDVKLLWTKVQNKDLNKNWTTSEISGAKKCNILSEEEAGKSINFLNDHIFSKINSKFFFKVLKPNLYVIDDLHKPTFGTMLMPVNYDLNGMDCWLFSFFGEGATKYPMYATDLHYLPTSEKEILNFRIKVFSGLFDQLFKIKEIEIPKEYIDNFDYVKAIKNKNTDDDDVDFYMNRGFCGTINTSKGLLAKLNSIRYTSPEKNFLSYMCLIAMYSKEDIENGAGIESVPFNNYPIIIKNYDFVDNYILTKYGYDLKQLHIL